MARINYDTETVHGATLAEAVNHLIRGRALLTRWTDAADIASNGGTVPTALEAGAFGAPSGEGDELWTLAASVKALIDGDDAGGLKTFLSSLDQGA